VGVGPLREGRPQSGTWGGGRGGEKPLEAHESPWLLPGKRPGSSGKTKAAIKGRKSRNSNGN